MSSVAPVIAVGKSRLRRKLLAVGGVLILLVLALIWWRVWQGGVKVGPLHAYSSSIQASDSSQFAASTATTDDSHIATRTIFVIPEGSGLLLDRIVAGFRARLLEDKNILVVQVGKQWQSPDGRLPDLVVRLRIDSLSEHDGISTRHLEATVHAGLSTGLDDSGSSSMHPGAPLSGSWQGTLSHKSDSVGDGIGSSRYQLTGPHIADDLAKKVCKQLDDWRDKYGEQPELPAALFPAFRPTTDVDFLKSMGAGELASGNALLSHNESWYSLEDARDSQVVLTELADRLKAAGWTLPELKATDVLQAKQGTRTFMVFVYKEFGGAMTLTTVPTAPRVTRYGMRYSDPMSDEERRGVWPGLLGSSEWRESGRILLQTMPAELQAEYYGKLEGAPEKSCREYYCLAARYSNLGDREAAKKWLRYAAAIGPFEQFGESPQMGSMRELAKKLGDEKMANGPVGVETLLEMGIPELFAPGGTQPSSVERTVAADQGVYAFAQNSGHIYVFNGQITAGGKARLITSELGMGSSSSVTSEVPPRGGPLRAEVAGGMNLGAKVTVEQTGPNLYRVTVGRLPK